MVTATSFNDTLWFAIAEPSRRKLIDALLSKGEATASKLAHDVPFSRQAASKHLVVLKKAGLIQSRRVGKELRFVVDPDGISTAARELSRAAALWDTRLQNIKLIAESISQESRLK